MKRKLALLLAAVMVIAAMPMNVFAASKNSITTSVNAENKTIVFEEGWVSNTSDKVEGNSDVKYWIDGTNLKIELDDNVAAGKDFKVLLENAKWFFRHKGDITVTGTPTTAMNKEDDVLAYPVDVASLPTVAVGTGTILSGLAASTAVPTSAAALAEVEAEVEAALTNAAAKGLLTNLGDISGGVLEGLQLQLLYSNAKAGYSNAVNSGTPTTTAENDGTTPAYSATSDVVYYGSDATDYYLDLVVEAIMDAIAAGDITVATDAGPTNLVFTVVNPVKADVDVTFFIATSTPTTTGTFKGYDSTFSGNFYGNLRSAVTEYVATDSYGAHYKPNTATNVHDSTYNTSYGLMNYYDNDKTYWYYRDSASATANENVDYILEVVTRGNESQARIEFVNAASKGDIMVIPLVMLTTGDGDVRVKIDSQLSGITSGNLLVGARVDGKTKGSTSSVTVRRNDMTIGKLKIEETKIGSIHNEKEFAFEIRAPRGYYFASDEIYYGSDLTAGVVGDRLHVYTEGGIVWTTNGAYSMTAGKLYDSSVDFDISFKVVKNEIDYTVLVVTVGPNVIQKSSRITGALYIQNLKIIAEDEDDIPFGKDLYLTLKNVKESIITEEDVKIATAADYDITLTRVKDKIPELISGRLEGDTTISTAGIYDGDDIDDDEHKAAKVKFAEKVADAWWAQRNTVFTLPEQVRFRKVKFDKDEIKELTTTAEASLKKGTNNDNSAEYFNTRKRYTNVTVNDNTLTLTNLAINNDKKASFEMDMWLSIQVDFAGDIDLTLNNRALKYAETDQDITCTIAKAIRPIEVNTTVTEAKVGYQYVTVADFDIVENIEGALLQKEEVFVSVTDEISYDMSIAKGFKASVTTGNVKIKDVTTGSTLGLGANQVNSATGNIRFTIDKASTVASTISFTDVQVKIDRYVPYSNVSIDGDRGINIHVWGPAVAKNYLYLDGNYARKDINTNDMFSVAGISTKYVNIATLATDSNQAGFSNHVTVTMGSTTYTVNGAEAQLEVAPYVSTASNSAMVPVRFVAYALGLPENAVKWDPATSTCTVDANTRIVQFQTGSSYYTLNGTPIAMVSPDGLPVAMEITNDRAFVPFRALGEAFAVTVDWDAATSTAIYNQPKVQ